MLHSIALDDHRVLAVSGSDRATFLQGQLTQDVASIRPDATVLTGWADSRGRLLFAGHAFSTSIGGDDALGLLVHSGIAEAVLTRLRTYVFRSKVQLAWLDVPVVGLTGTPEAGSPAPAIRLLDSTGRYLLLNRAVDTSPGARSDWELADIRAGLPTITAATTGEFVPQMVNLDLLGGISFTKGCYTGQEIVARMKYRGRVKRRMLRFSAEGEPPPPGAPLYAARGVAGQVVRAAAVPGGAEFLAVVVLDDLPGPFQLDEERKRTARRLDLPYEIPV